jgi:sigma54-dependent transcription regulator
VDNSWVVKLLSGTVVRGIMWALAGVCAYLSARGIQADTPDASKITPVVEGILTFVLPIIASLWSKKKDAKLLGTEPPSTPAV